MPFAAGVRFNADAFPRYFNPADFDIAVDDFCVVEDDELHAERVGYVSSLEGRAEAQMKVLPSIVRPASEDEIRAWYEEKIVEREWLQVARDRAEHFRLPMKIGDLTILNDRRQVFIHFTADGRVDFRALVRDLAARFKMRIDLWQIGPRQEAAQCDGMGVCGERLCCSRWLHNFPRVSMRHARDQDIVQPPSKLAGPCGRLRCCLSYEHETYAELAEQAPPVGCRGCIERDGCGRVIERNLLKREVTLKIDDGGLTRAPFAAFRPAGE